MALSDKNRQARFLYSTAPAVSSKIVQVKLPKKKVGQLTVSSLRGPFVQSFFLLSIFLSLAYNMSCRSSWRGLMAVNFWSSSSTKPQNGRWMSTSRWEMATCCGVRSTSLPPNLNTKSEACKEYNCRSPKKNIVLSEERLKIEMRIETGRSPTHHHVGHVGRGEAELPQITWHELVHRWQRLMQ